MAAWTCLRLVIAAVGGAGTAKPKQIAEVISAELRRHAREFFFCCVALIYPARESSRMIALEINYCSPSRGVSVGCSRPQAMIAIP